MQKNRRNFLLALAWASGGLVASGAPLEAQDPKHKTGFPEPPPPADPREQDKNAAPANPKTAQKTILKENEKEFRAGIEKLNQMTGELKAELEKTPTTQVLSVRMYKKVQEIERLAKQLKDKAKG